MISAMRREMFGDIYRLAEFYEDPPFKPGDIDGNSAWFIAAHEAQLMPFLRKYQTDPLASELAMAIVEEASKKAAVMNNK